MKTRVYTNANKTPYFQNGHRAYGRYQWNVKRYDWHRISLESEAFEQALEDLRCDTIEVIQYKLGALDREISIGFDGRSSGWLVIDSPLTDDELALIDMLVDHYHETPVEELVDVEAYE